MEKTKFILRIPTELNKKLVDIAKQRGMAKNALIVQELWEIPKKYK